MFWMFQQKAIFRPGLVSSLLAMVSLQAETIPRSEPAFRPLPQGTSWDAHYGQGVQRTVRILESSGPEHHPTVRILFYGQSITQQDWWKSVAADLRTRYPHADLQIENRALGGFASQLLKQTAHTDLYPFYPDLLVFHVYGSHVDYEEIIRETRRLTTAEILLQTDHVRSMRDMDEQTDPTLVSKQEWDSWFPNAFVPGVAASHHTGLIEERNLWKVYLKTNALKPSDLLKDDIHLNAHGCHLLREIFKAHLVRRPAFDALIPANGTLREFVAGKDVSWHEGVLEIPFEGNRVDILPGPQGGGEVEVLLDGKPPSEFPALVGFNRTSAVPGTDWPAIRMLGHRTPLIPETWSARVSSISPDGKTFRFEVEGSVTGPDGAGDSSATFVSRSGRVVIEPDVWSLDYAVAVFKKPLDAFTIHWQAEPRFLDRVVLTADRPGGEKSVTVAQGMENGPHVLVLRAKGAAAPVLRSIRAYSPPRENGGKQKSSASAF